MLFSMVTNHKKAFQTKPCSTNQLKYDLMWQGMSITDASRKHCVSPAEIKRRIEEGGWKKVAKICSKCAKVRLLSEYSADKRARDGRASACKACRSPFGEGAFEISAARAAAVRKIREGEKAVAEQHEAVGSLDVTERLEAEDD